MYEYTVEYLVPVKVKVHFRQGARHREDIETAAKQLLRRQLNSPESDTWALRSIEKREVKDVS